jgi:hypothetical protein
MLYAAQDFKILVIPDTKAYSRSLAQELLFLWIVWITKSPLLGAFCFIPPRCLDKHPFGVIKECNYLGVPEILFQRIKQSRTP